MDADWSTLPILGGGYGPKKKRNSPAWLVVHHSYTDIKGRVKPATWWAGVFDRIHRKDNGWSSIGYHFVISPEGEIARGRWETARGAHSVGFNSQSIGLCLVGNFDISDPPSQQWSTLRALCLDLMRRYGILASNVIGHREANILHYGEMRKTCPGKLVDMSEFREDLAVEAWMHKTGWV